MHRRWRCLRWLISGMTAAALCLVAACTSQSPPTDRDSPGVSASAERPPSSAVPPDFTLIKHNVEKRLDSGDFSLNAIHAVLVNADGKTVVSVYRDFGPKDYSDVWSVTKSVMNILVGIAIDEGRLKLDDTLSELLPQYADRMTDGAKAVTLRQLLTMTAGTDPNDDFDIEANDAVGQIISNAFVSEPGTEFVYSNEGAHLVAGILQYAIDRPLLDYAREKLFDPLGIDTRPALQGSDLVAFRRPGFGWLSDREGINLGCCKLKLTAPDMVKIGRLYLDQGRWHGRQLVSRQWVAESTVDQLTTEKSPFDKSGGYGYLWWVNVVDGHPYFAAQGSYGQIIMVVPDLRLIVVTVGDEAGLASPSPAYFSMLKDDIVGAIVRA